MGNEEVIIESFDGAELNKVAVLPYDKESKTFIESPIDVITRGEAFYKYIVVGEIYNGELKLYDDDETVESYYDNDYLGEEE